jgi:hypothetical protein
MTARPDACDAVCQALWPDPTAPAPAEAMAHYRACLACRQFFVRERRLEERLARLGRPEAPTALRATIAAEITRPR